MLKKSKVSSRKSREYTLYITPDDCMQHTGGYLYMIEFS